jgi:hypothetical protein
LKTPSCQSASGYEKCCNKTAVPKKEIHPTTFCYISAAKIKIVRRRNVVKELGHYLIRYGIICEDDREVMQYILAQTDDVINFLRHNTVNKLHSWTVRKSILLII